MKGLAMNVGKAVAAELNNVGTMMVAGFRLGTYTGAMFVGAVGGLWVVCKIGDKAIQIFKKEDSEDEEDEDE